MDTTTKQTSIQYTINKHRRDLSINKFKKRRGYKNKLEINNLKEFSAGGSASVHSEGRKYTQTKHGIDIGDSNGFKNDTTIYYQSPN